MLKTGSFVLALLTIPVAANAAIIGPDGVLRYPLGDQMPALRCKPLFVCDLVLEPGEQIINVAVGDSVRWLIAPASSGGDTAIPHVLVKPTEAGLHTNLIVTTNRRTYYLSLISSATNPMPRIGFLYPQDPQRAFATHAQRESAAQSLAQTSIDRLDFAYRISGDRAIQPVRAFNDGTHTYLEMAKDLHDVPVLFSVGSDGDALVNYRFIGRYFVVDGVPDAIALVEGSGKHQRRALATRENR